MGWVGLRGRCPRAPAGETVSPRTPPIRGRVGRGARRARWPGAPPVPLSPHGPMMEVQEDAFLLAGGRGAEPPAEPPHP
jgi:hypothetical protein